MCEVIRALTGPTHKHTFLIQVRTCAGVYCCFAAAETSRATLLLLLSPRLATEQKSRENTSHQSSGAAFFRALPSYWEAWSSHTGTQPARQRPAAAPAAKMTTIIGDRWSPRKRRLHSCSGKQAVHSFVHPAFHSFISSFS